MATLTEFTCKVQVSGSRKPSGPIALTLDQHEMVLHDKSLLRVPYCSIYGYEAPNQQGQDENSLTVVIHTITWTSADLSSVSGTKKATHRILFNNQSDLERFMDEAKKYDAFPKPRRILLVVNPNGGIGKAKHICDTVVKPMLEKSGLIIKEQHTEYARHAVDIAHNLDLDSVDDLVVVSGDGVLHEIVNGLLSRPDWDRARKLPVGIIPAGSANAIATSFGTRNPYVATLSAIRGRTIKMDIYSLSQLNRPRKYALLLFSWGMMADSDIESDNYRWLGAFRFEIAGFIRMFRLRRYAGKVYVLPPTRREEIDSTASASPTLATPPDSPSHNPTTTGSASTTEVGPESRYRSLLEKVDEEPPRPWKLLRNMPYYTMLLLLNVPAAGENIFFTNTIRINDGVMRLFYSCETQFRKIFLPFVLDLANGKLLQHGLLRDIECGGVLVVPGVEGKPSDESTHEVVNPELVTSPWAKTRSVYTKPGIFDIDGEVMPTTRTLIEVLPSFMDLVVPEWYSHEQDKGAQAEAARERTQLLGKAATIIPSSSKGSAIGLAVLGVVLLYVTYSLVF
ncbi:hypothetical protein BGW38_003713 [Lunasporangiospora selenospora]|uniref:DAGKc domain-containing protein n=1 Tax=Lunasporangiospora selenospora TaxID=979761 RepID=A0A9P6FR20_9FUNG|nr:hypothetical protein BGW38_003713 [Lunasporangiospora selenospora]